MRLLAGLSAGVVCAVLVALALRRRTRTATLDGTRNGPRPRARLSERVPRAVWLQQAGLAVTPTQFWFGTVALGFVTFIGLTVATHAPLVALAPALGAGAIPYVVTSRRRVTRMRAWQTAWPDALRELIAAIVAGRSLPQAVTALGESGPEPLRSVFADFPAMTRVFGFAPALEQIRNRLADATTDRVIEVLIVAHDRGGSIVRDVLEDLVVATTKDLKVLDEIDTDGLEIRINARAVLVLPWLVLVALTLRAGPFRDFYQSRAGVLVVCGAAVMSALGAAWLGRLGRQPDEPRVLRRRARDGGFGRMTASVILVAIAIAVMAAAVVGLVVGVRAPLADRLRPYRAGPAASSPAAGSAWTADRRSARDGSTQVGFTAWAQRLRGLWPSTADERLATQLRAAGFDERDVEDVRIRQVAQAAGFGAAGVVLGGVVLHSPVMTLSLAGCGAAVGFTRSPGRIARLAEERRTRMRLELVTIDQLLAIQVRAGAGPVQAVARLTDRGNGVVVDELREILVSIRVGRSEAEAFRHAAATTAEPHAARTYRLFALAAEHGADLGAALRALSDDLRDVRRDELRRTSTRRRAAMLVPTIAVLAPIMLLFVIAPLPSIVLGGR